MSKSLPPQTTVHLIPDRLVHPGSYAYRMDGPNEEFDATPEEAADLIARGVFHDRATLPDDWSPPGDEATSEPEGPADAGPSDSAGIPA